MPKGPLIASKSNLSLMYLLSAGVLSAVFINLASRHLGKQIVVFHNKTNRKNLPTLATKKRMSQVQLRKNIILV